MILGLRTFLVRETPSEEVLAAGKRVGFSRRSLYESKRRLWVTEP